MAHVHGAGGKSYLAGCEGCRGLARAQYQGDERRRVQRIANNRRWRERHRDRASERAEEHGRRWAGERAERNEKIVAMYRQGRTGPEIAGEFGLTASSITRIVAAAGVPVRPRGTRSHHRSESRGIVQYERGSVASRMTPEELAAFRRWLHEHDLYSRQLARTAAV